MEIFLDTADIAQIKALVVSGAVSGVTTNPSIIHKNGDKLQTIITQIAKIVDGPVSCEVIASDAKNMILQGKIAASWHPNVYVKLPCTSDGLEACRALKLLGICTNITLVFSVSQANAASEAGATLVSPFVGRLDDAGQDGVQLIHDIRTVFDYSKSSTKILAASVRSIEKLTAVMLAGADIATISPEIFSAMLTHPLTDAGLKIFQQDSVGITF